MRRFLVCLSFCLLGGASLVTLMDSDPGYVLLTWNGWQLETSIWLAVFFLLLFGWLIWAALQLFRSTWQIPQAFRSWIGIKSRHSIEQRLDRGIVAFFEGRWEAAEKLLTQKSSSVRRTIVYPLYAAMAAYRRGEDDIAQELFDLSIDEGEIAEELVWMIRAELYMEQGADVQAERELKRLGGRFDRLPTVLKLRAELAFRQQDWSILVALLPDLRKFRAVSSVRMAELETTGWASLMADDTVALDERLSLWKKAPDSLKSQESAAVANLFKALRSSSSWAALEELLFERLQRHYDPAAFEAVAYLPEAYGSKLLKVLKKWRAEDRDGSCHLALARLAARLGNHSESNNFWVDAYRYSATAATAMEWSAVSRECGDVERAEQLEKRLWRICKREDFSTFLCA